jgi:hypothetical protein
MVQEPIYMTYNFFLTAIGLPAVALYVKYLIVKNDQRVDEAVKLKDALFHQSIESIQKSIEDWQDGARERTASLCKKIDTIAQELKDKVSSQHCHEKHEVVRSDINDIKSKIYT